MSNTAIKITKFFGEAPKVSPELLPETVAQYAFNLDVSSGDLLPYRRPENTATLDKPGVIQTIYPMKDPSDNLKWLHWTTDVDIATAQIENDTTQRIYYTGDGAPKATNYALATSGAMFPTSNYTLGLPLPSATITAAATAFTQKSSTTRSRDSGNVATVVTSAAHGLYTGAIVTTSSFGGTGYNLTNVPVTVINTTTFTFFSYGSAEGATADAAGRVDLAGATFPRAYVFTYLTDWDEESVPSEPSATIFVKEGQIVTVNGLPASWTHGAGYQTTNMMVRVYRTVASVSGTLYYKIAEVALGTTSVVDNIDVSTLDELLESTDYDAPETTMQGMLAIHNGMLVGFFGNTVCFCEPGKPHAWPIKYRQQVDAEIVALGGFGTTLVVATDKTPWIFTGNNPAAQSITRTDYVLPCSSKQSMVNLGFGVSYSTAGGLALYSSTLGADYLTKNVHSWTTWPQAVDPALLVGEYYRGRYFGSDGTNTFIFERNDQVGGHLIQSDIKFTAAYYQSDLDKFYYADGSTVWLWDSPNIGPASLDWKSKVFTTKGFINFGAARVVADYSTPEGEAAVEMENTVIRAANAALIAAGNPMGAMGTHMYNELQVAGSPLTPLVETEFSATFQLYTDKQLRFSTTRFNSDMFRLPSGYRTDTFEVRIATTARVRAIHLAETPSGLKTI